MIYDPKCFFVRNAMKCIAPLIFLLKKLTWSLQVTSMIHVYPYPLHLNFFLLLQNNIELKCPLPSNFSCYYMILVEPDMCTHCYSTADRNFIVNILLQFLSAVQCVHVLCYVKKRHCSWSHQWCLVLVSIIVYRQIWED